MAATCEAASSRRRVLVTGATGMLGSHVVDRLRARGDHVVALDRAAPEIGYAWADLTDPFVETVTGDITDADLIRSLVPRVDAVVHVAAVLAKAAGDPPGPLLEVNVVATHTLFDVAAGAGVPVVFASSGSVYGPNRPAVDGAAPAPFTEFDLPHELGFYALSKHVDELYADAFARTVGLRWIALRLGTLFGARLRMGLTSRFLLSVCDDLVAGRQPEVSGDPDSGLDWVHVTDAAELFAAAVDAATSGRVTGVALNASTGTATRLEDVLTRLLHAADAAPHIRWTGPQPTGRFSSARHYDNTRAGELLGVRPSADLAVGLRAYLDWRTTPEENAR